MGLISNALNRLTEIRARTDSILVGVSGGKDSLVVLDLCCQVFPRVEGFCMQLLDIEMASYDAKVAARRHGIKLHVVPHWMTARMLKHAVMRWHRVDASSIPASRLVDIETHLRAETGIAWIANGERMVDSMVRRFRYAPTNGIIESSQHVAPICDWLDRDVVGYLRVKRIPLPERWSHESIAHGSGFELTAPCLAYMKQKYPADYERIKQAFPFCEVFEKRRQFQAAQGAEVPSEAAPPEPNSRG